MIQASWECHTIPSYIPSYMKGAVYMNFEVTELLKFWMEKIIEITLMEREKPSLGFLLEKGPEFICVPRYEKR